MVQKRKKLVVHCASGIRNTGDEAILDVVLASFRDSCEITVISLDAAYSQKMHEGAVFIDNKDPRWKRAVRDCDLFLLGGGGLIQDKTTFFNAERWLAKLRYAIRHGKKTMLYANSLEPLKYGWNRHRVKHCLQQADVITLRDALSRRIAEQLGIRGVETEVTADPVYGYEEMVSETAGCADREIRYELPENYVVMTIRHWYDTHPFIPVRICSRLGIRTKENRKNYERYVVRLAKIAETINKEQGLPIVWLSCCYGRDAKAAKDVIARLSCPERNQIIDEEYMKPSEAMEIIGGARLLIGMRLHGFIYAFLKRTPVVMLSYQEKVRGMAQMAGVTDACFSVDDFTVEQVMTRAAALLVEPEPQLVKTADFAERMKAAQNRNVERALRLLGEWND